MFVYTSVIANPLRPLTRVLNTLIRRPPINTFNTCRGKTVLSEFIKINLISFFFFLPAKEFLRKRFFSSVFRKILLDFHRDRPAWGYKYFRFELARFKIFEFPDSRTIQTFTRSLDFLINNHF